MRLASLHTVLFLCLLVLVGCTKQASNVSLDSAPDLQSNKIFAVSYPLQFLTQQIAGDQFKVQVPFDANSNPRISRPTREMVRQMQAADLIVANGVGARYAKWLVAVSLPQSKIIYCASHGLALKEFVAIEGESIVHSHGPQGEHSHQVMAARTWLNPSLAKKQANYISEQMKKTYPEEADRFADNLGALHAQLDELVAAMDRLKMQIEKKDPILLSGDSAHTFLIQAMGYWDSPLVGLPRSPQETEVDVIQLTRIETQFEKYENSNRPRLALCGSVPLPQRLADFYQGLDVQTVKIDLLDHPPVDGDFISVMQSNITQIAETLRLVSLTESDVPTE